MSRKTYWQLGLLTEKAGEHIEARHTNGRFKEQAAAERARDHTKEPLVVTEVREGTKQDRTPRRLTRQLISLQRPGLVFLPRMRCGLLKTYMNG